jgi:alkanesulfonate monooxygenase SsuD/methylene tetrahydromethanopterin reductase-like flavin-dependent oxidoreductase (luciferase family)
MLGVNVFAADTDAEARLVATSIQQAFVNLRRGRPVELPPPVEGFIEQIAPHERAMLEDALACTVAGSPDVIRAGLEAFVENTGADELMITSQIYDFDARLRSYEITGIATGRTNATNAANATQ